jgi:hypothetical protein
MKKILLAACLFTTGLSAQNLQLHYDLRHTVDPDQNPHNFPALYYEYFKARDSGHAFIKPAKNGGRPARRGHQYKYASYTRPTNDFIYTFYWWKACMNYKLELAGDFSCWTENKNHGDAATAALNCHYRVNTVANTFQAYSTLAIRAKL